MNNTTTRTTVYTGDRINFYSEEVGFRSGRVVRTTRDSVFVGNGYSRNGEVRTVRVPRTNVFNIIV